jgi:hypothetical protein
VISSALMSAERVSSRAAHGSVGSCFEGCSQGRPHAWLSGNEFLGVAGYVHGFEHVAAVVVAVCLLGQDP